MYIQSDEQKISQQLVERAVAGDDRAFQLLMRTWQGRLTGIAVNVLGQHADAEDVVQETFVRAHRALADFRAESAFFTWLYRILLNVIHSHRSSMQRRGAGRTERVDDLEEQGHFVWVQEYGPEQEVMGEQSLTQIQDALSRLPEEFRQTFLLREMEGMSYEEIALALDCPIGTVRSRIARAREELDRLLRDMH